MNSAREILISVVIKNKGEWQKILADIQAKNVEEEPLATNQSCLTLVDQDYPTSLKQGYQPPFVLFYEGDLSLFKAAHKIAIMGSKDSNPKLLDKLIDSKDTGSVYVLSGISQLDKYVVDMPNVNKVIVVLPYAIDQMDEEIKDQVLSNGGLIITNVPNGIEPTKEGFAYQNILISNVCDKMLILKCGNKSSILVSVMNMLELNKDIMIIPLPIEEEGYANNQLIYQGAIHVYNQETYKDQVYGVGN